LVNVIVNTKVRAITFSACACATVAGAIAWPTEAQALIVNVGGTNYNVSTFVGNYNVNASRFTVGEMPWFGNSSLAQQFAAALGTGLGLPNSFGNAGPMFAYSANSSYAGVWVYVSTSAANAVPTSSVNLTYAVASQAPSTAVPGPLPLFGAAAAFGWSRRLRSRIAGNNASEATGRRPCSEASA
jgi:hypothetical protein